MIVKSIRVEWKGERITAQAISCDKTTGQQFSCELHDLGGSPYYMLDGARHDLSQHEKKKLGELLKEGADKEEVKKNGKRFFKRWQQGRN